MTSKKITEIKRGDLIVWDRAEGGFAKVVTDWSEAGFMIRYHRVDDGHLQSHRIEWDPKSKVNLHVE